jgi:hypothetical protein
MFSVSFRFWREPEFTLAFYRRGDNTCNRGSHRPNQCCDEECLACSGAQFNVLSWVSASWCVHAGSSGLISLDACLAKAAHFSSVRVGTSPLSLRVAARENGTATFHRRPRLFSLCQRRRHLPHLDARRSDAPNGSKDLNVAVHLHSLSKSRPRIATSLSRIKTSKIEKFRPESSAAWVFSCAGNVCADSFSLVRHSRSDLRVDSSVYHIFRYRCGWGGRILSTSTKLQHRRRGWSVLGIMAMPARNLI